MPLWSLCPARFFSLLSLGRTLFWYSSLIHSSPRCRQSGGEEAGLTSELAVTFVKFGFTAALFRIFFPCNLFLNLSLISSSFFSSCVCTQNYTILDFSQTCIKTWNEILLKSKKSQTGKGKQLEHCYVQLLAFRPTTLSFQFLRIFSLSSVSWCLSSSFLLFFASSFRFFISSLILFSSSSCFRLSTSSSNSRWTKSLDNFSACKNNKMNLHVPSKPTNFSN